MPDRRARRAPARVLRRSEPKSATVPEVGRTRPSATRAAVDLPDPDSPTRPTVSPGRTVIDTSSSARTARRPRPKTTDTSRRSTTGSSGPGRAAGPARSSRRAPASATASRGTAASSRLV